MKKNRLKNKIHTRRDTFVYAIDEKDLPASSSKTLPSKRNRQYMVTITFDNGKFVSVKTAFPQDSDQRALYRVFADINEEINRITDNMDTDVSIQETIKTHEIEKKLSPGKKLAKLVIKKDPLETTRHKKKDPLETTRHKKLDSSAYSPYKRYDDVPF